MVSRAYHDSLFMAQASRACRRAHAGPQGHAGTVSLLLRPLPGVASASSNAQSRHFIRHNSGQRCCQRACFPARHPPHLQIAPTGMIFIPCRNGWSHRPDEYASPQVCPPVFPWPALRQRALHLRCCACPVPTCRAAVTPCPALLPRFSSKRGGPRSDTSCRTLPGESRCWR